MKLVSLLTFTSTQVLVLPTLADHVGAQSPGQNRRFENVPSQLISRILKGRFNKLNQNEAYPPGSLNINPVIASYDDVQQYQALPKITLKTTGVNLGPGPGSGSIPPLNLNGENGHFQPIQMYQDTDIGYRETNQQMGSNNNNNYSPRTNGNNNHGHAAPASQNQRLQNRQISSPQQQSLHDLNIFPDEIKGNIRRTGLDNVNLSLEQIQAIVAYTNVIKSEADQASKDREKYYRSMNLIYEDQINNLSKQMLEVTNSVKMLSQDNIELKKRLDDVDYVFDEGSNRPTINQDQNAIKDIRQSILDLSSVTADMYSNVQSQVDSLKSQNKNMFSWARNITQEIKLKVVNKDEFKVTQDQVLEMVDISAHNKISIDDIFDKLEEINEKVDENNFEVNDAISRARLEWSDSESIRQTSSAPVMRSAGPTISNDPGIGSLPIVDMDSEKLSKLLLKLERLNINQIAPMRELNKLKQAMIQFSKMKDLNNARSNKRFQNINNKLAAAVTDREFDLAESRLTISKASSDLEEVNKKLQLLEETFTDKLKKTEAREKDIENMLDELLHASLK